MELSVLQAAKHASFPLGNHASLRKAIKHEDGNLRLKARESFLSVVSQNMALLMPATFSGVIVPESYLGTDRDGVIDELCTRILAEPPDVLCLSEVWCDEYNPLCSSDEKEKIRSKLSEVYKFSYTGPDPTLVPAPNTPDKGWDFFNPVKLVEAAVEPVKLKATSQNGGLLVLSKHPVLEYDVITYNDSVGNDSMVNKGAIHIRIHPPASIHPWDIFFSHTQDIEPEGGREVLYYQLGQLDAFIRAKSTAANPALLVGDLNIPAENSSDYMHMITALNEPSDLWKVMNPQDPAFTYVTDNNFFEDDDDAPKHNSRLDYMLLRAGSSFVPVLEDLSIVKWTHNGRFISDHFGFKARFNRVLQIEQSGSG